MKTWDQAEQEIRDYHDLIIQSACTEKSDKKTLANLISLSCLGVMLQLGLGFFNISMRIGELEDKIDKLVKEYAD